MTAHICNEQSIETYLFVISYVAVLDCRSCIHVVDITTSSLYSYQCMDHQLHPVCAFEEQNHLQPHGHDCRGNQNFFKGFLKIAINMTTLSHYTTAIITTASLMFNGCIGANVAILSPYMSQLIIRMIRISAWHNRTSNKERRWKLF